MARVVREDLRDLEQVREITPLEHLVDLLPSKVGSPLSVKSLREDLQIDHKTAERRKLYLWDWSSVEDKGPRFENLVACKREVDFVVLRGRKPLFAVECKSGGKNVGAAIRYFAERTPIPRFFQAHLGEQHFSTGKITVLPFVRLCEELELP